MCFSVLDLRWTGPHKARNGRTRKYYDRRR